MQDESLINGLLAKREELKRESADLSERMAVLCNDIEAIDRVLDACGHRGGLVGITPRHARLVLFYRNELRDYLLAELRKAPEPLTSWQLACLVCQSEGRDSKDRRMLVEVTRRVGAALRKMLTTKLVEAERAPFRIRTSALGMLAKGRVCGLRKRRGLKLQPSPN